MTKEQAIEVLKEEIKYHHKFFKDYMKYLHLDSDERFVTCAQYHKRVHDAMVIALEVLEREES